MARLCGWGWFVLLVAGLPACEAEERFIEARCAWEARCEPAGLSGYLGSDMEGCQAMLGCLRGDLILQPGCAEVLAQASCEPGALERAFEAEPCRPPTPEAARTRGDAERQQEGEPCGLRSCAEGLLCAPAGRPDGCWECQPGGEVPDGESCAGLYSCGDHAYCDADDICVPSRGEGETCESTRQCDEGYCSPAGRCMRPAPGAACESAADCPVGHRCAQGACEEAPDLGEPCDNAERVAWALGISPGRGCKPPLACVQGRCVEAACAQDAAIGEPCGLATFCERGSAVCHHETAVCTRLPRAGEPCDPDWLQHVGTACAEGSRCGDDGVCRALREDGEPCDDSSQCAVGVCSPESGRCGAPPFPVWALCQ